MNVTFKQLMQIIKECITFSFYRNLFQNPINKVFNAWNYRRTAGSILAHSVTRRYLLALSLVAIATISGAVGLTLALLAQAQHAEIVNVAGAQRMLSQRVSALAGRSLMTRNDADRETILRLLSAAVDRMERGHLRLTTPQERAPKYATPELKAHYDGMLVNLDERVTIFISEIRHFLDGDGRDAALMKSFAADALGSLLEDLDHAVTLYQSHAEAEIGVIKSLHFSIVAVALLLLLFEGVYIFRPMAKMVQTQADDLERRATIDGLTGLLNRSAFEARFRAKLDDARAEPGRGSTIALAVISIDLDWFKEVNDLEGHAAGDAVLREIGARIRAVASEGCLASRMGGDEFVIVVPFGAADQRCRDMADRIRKAIERPLPWNGKSLRVGATIGIANFPDHGSGFDQLLNAADYALREGKKLGKGATQPFASEHQASLERQTAILQTFEAGVPPEGLVIALQPVIDLNSGALTGCEALARWRHPHLGLLRPADFLDLAAAHGHGAWLGQHLRSAAFGAFAQLRGAGLAIQHLAINVSSSEVDALPSAELLAGQLATYGLTIADIQIEIVEDVMLDRVSDRVQKKLEELRQAGFALSLDDFGTGYASLSHLTTFPVDVIKIDRQFVGPILTDPRCRQVATAIINLAHLLGARVIAEGVEATEQQLLLKGIGCDFAQGFLYAPAMTPDEFLDWARRSGFHAAADAKPETTQDAHALSI